MMTSRLSKLMAIACLTGTISAFTVAPGSLGLRSAPSVLPTPTSTLTREVLSSTALFNTLKQPAELYQGAIELGAKKAHASWGKIFRLGIVAGAHISFGAYLAMTVGTALPQIAATNPGLQKMIFGAFGFPVGLLMTLVSGAELFTGNAALVTGAVMEGKATKKELVKSWVASYAGNLVGSVLMAYLVYKSGTFGAAMGPVDMGLYKTSHSFDVTVIRATLCNWLVCMAVYMASGTSTMIGKAVAVWFPISAFVALGLEHSVANMFIIPLAMFRGAQITLSQLWLKSLIPVTLGNIIGGAICVMLPYGTTYGNWFKNKKSE